MAEYALLFRDAQVVDGSGRAPFRSDVAVDGGHIVAVGRLDGATAGREVIANGRVVCPGFIDVHSHSDLPLLADPHLQAKVRQGVTTELIGADGLSYAPLSPERLAEVRRYLAGVYGNPANLRIDSDSVASFLGQFDGGVASNVFYVVPHQALRLQARGWRGGPASDSELQHMGALLREGLAEGALGLGTGLDYFPHGTCTTDELATLCHVVAEANGVLVIHVRYLAIGVLAAVREAIEVAERSGVKVLISHMRTPAALPLIDAARDRGLDIQFDAYPYTAGNSTMLVFISHWAHEGGPEQLRARLADSESRRRLAGEPHPRLLGDLDTITVTTVGAADHLTDYEGRSLAWIMARRGQPDPVEAVCDLLLETDLAIGWIGHSGTEDELQTCLRHPAHMVSTDGCLVGGKPHPRGWGTYPRLLGRYVRDLGVLSLETCVRKMTSMPAERFGLAGRGLVRAGYAADLVLFDPLTVADRATFENPRQYPLGISHVVVNGQLVVDDGAATGALAGRALTPRRLTSPTLGGSR
jgi:N-acyl-D-amino-acid deacylase